jgi:hypothetical protein
VYLWQSFNKSLLLSFCGTFSSLYLAFPNSVFVRCRDFIHLPECLFGLFNTSSLILLRASLCFRVSSWQRHLPKIVFHSCPSTDRLRYVKYYHIYKTDLVNNTIINNNNSQYLTIIFHVCYSDQSDNCISILKLNAYFYAIAIFIAVYMYQNRCE